ncbi:MAG TPA: hypothetical protein VHA09_04455 [Nitrososphaera sp.]|nr:hypothetical protein [Nitrososphaera sp.]
MHDNSTTAAERQRGKAAIDTAHAGIAREDEGRVSTLISDSYGVDNAEALDIHTNYHAERIISALEKRARENGMGKATFDARVQDLDVASQAYQVATGQLAEAAAVDIIFRNLYRMEGKGRDNDRYVNFYG